jgi:DNA modification methylase
LEDFPKLRTYATYSEPDWKPPLYNIWRYGKTSNNTNHFGKTEQSITDNLLYLYTEPFDIVVDPFGGGGSTIDVCKHRLRRYWVSDRLPIVERTDIRQYDVQDGPPPLHKRWQDVSLMYLDPPYWKQAANQYSEDAEDLANMPLDEFYNVLTRFITECSEKMHNGSHIALIIQPTQWLAPDRHFPVDHVFDLVTRLSNNELLRYRNRVICPYATEQYNPQQVEWAKSQREILTLNRELIIWQVIK